MRGELVLWWPRREVLARDYENVEEQMARWPEMAQSRRRCDDDAVVRVLLDHRRRTKEKMGCGHVRRRRQRRGGIRRWPHESVKEVDLVRTPFHRPDALLESPDALKEAPGQSPVSSQDN
jgi:hypothetical protein